MELSTIFKLSLYGLIACVGAILGSAESEGGGAAKNSELYLPYLSIPIAICSYLLTERSAHGRQTNGGGIHPILANLLAVIALYATVRRVKGFEIENRESILIAGTHLLVFATWIVLFLEKNVRSYWFLLTLGILQLAIAGVLTRSEWFGLSAIAYVFGSVWTLSIFTLWRAEQLTISTDRIRRFQTVKNGAEPRIPAPNLERSSSEVYGTIHHENGMNWLSVRFLSGVLTMAMFGLLVSALFFVCIPRVWVSDFTFGDDFVRSTPIKSSSKAQTASTTVGLGDLGNVLASVERVFEMQITNIRTQQRFKVQDYADQLGLNEPLFRSSVLTVYSNGKWRPVSEPKRPRSTFSESSRIENDYDLRQDIRLAPNGSQCLFCLGIPKRIEDHFGALLGQYEFSTGISTKSDAAPIEYSVFSMSPPQQSRFKLPASKEIKEMYVTQGNNVFSRMLDNAPSNLSALKRLANEVIENASVIQNRMRSDSPHRELTAFEKAEAIEYYLQTSGGYKYSLNASIQNPKIDPVEDFLFNQKAGHCEHFATALALMLRAVGIPARLVLGYKGGIQHDKNQEYSFEVQQKFAHVWVEAWVDDSDFGWTTFDATPIDDRATSIANVTAKQSSLWSDFTSALTSLWSNDILNMSLDRQERSVYKPLRTIGASLLKIFQELFTSPSSSLETLQELLNNYEEWFSIGGGFVAFLLLSAIVSIFWIVRRNAATFRNWLVNGATRDRQSSQRIVEFYDRFAKIMSTQGLKREPAQTQHEFAIQVAANCQSKLSAEGLMDAPEQISKYFYRVRYGDENLPQADLDQLDASLTRLEQVLSITRKPTSPVASN